MDFRIIALLFGTFSKALFGNVDFESDILPLFEDYCYDCHGPDKEKSGFRTDKRVHLLKGGDTGLAAIVPGNVQQSYLIEVIKSDDPEIGMPPKGGKLFDDEIESIRYHDELAVVPESAALPVSLQLDKIQKAYPLGKVTQYIPSKDPSLANKFDVRLADGRSVLVTTNQYTGEVIGEIDRSDSWYQLANDIHGTLLMGQWGDYLIEIAASLSILLIMTGVYLWWPRDNASKAGFFKIRLSNIRLLMRDLHANFAALFSFVLLFFLLSGLAWTSVWGAKLVQAWNTFPVYYHFSR